MARVLLVWEYGEDLGHVRILMPIARELRAMGHDPCFAFRDPLRLDVVVRAGFEGFPAPSLPSPRALDPAPANFSGVLLNLGYEERPALAGVLRAWADLLALLRPEVVVCEYAPTALIAARRASIPRATIGTGFWQPTAFEPCPALRPGVDTPAARLEELDARLATAIARGLGAAPVALRELFQPGADLICTFAQLDPLGPRAVEYLGPVDGEGEGLSIAWKGEAHPRIFAYLKPRDARFGVLLRALRALGGDAVVAAPGLAAAEAAAASSASLRVVPDAVLPGPLLDSADLCVSHAGPGMAAHALLAGVPMALLPMHLEQFLVARRLAAAGIGVMVAPGETLAEPEAWLRQAVEDAGLRERSRAHAAGLRGFSFEATRTRVARDIAGLAAG